MGSPETKDPENREEGTVQDREGEEEETPGDDAANDWLLSAQMSGHKFTVREHVFPSD
jgi:hypothetical protein